MGKFQYPNRYTILHAVCTSTCTTISQRWMIKGNTIVHLARQIATVGYGTILLDFVHCGN